MIANYHSYRLRLYSPIDRIAQRRAFRPTSPKLVQASKLYSALASTELVLECSALIKSCNCRPLHKSSARQHDQPSSIANEREQCSASVVAGEPKISPTKVSILASPHLRIFRFAVISPVVCAKCLALILQCVMDAT